MSAGVEIDTAAVSAAMARLAAGVESGSRSTALEQAGRTADALRARIPVRSGRLVSTVDTVAVPDGAGVTYGAGLPYARYIARRTGALEDLGSSAAQEFGAAEIEMARKECARL